MLVRWAQSTATSTGSDIHRILLKIIAGYSGIQTDPSNITTWGKKIEDVADIKTDNTHRYRCN